MTRTPPPKQPKTPQEALMAQINQALPLIEAAGLADADAIARVKAEKAKFERHLNNLDYFTRVYDPLGWTPYSSAITSAQTRSSCLSIVSVAKAMSLGATCSSTRYRDCAGRTS